MLINLFGLFYLQIVFASSQDTPLHVCNEVTKPDININQENCTVICGLYRHVHILPRPAQEIALCIKDEFTPLLCRRDEECNHYHHELYCKKVQCFCEENNRVHRFLPKQSSDFVKICVAPSSWLQPKVPLVSFPWKTVLAVFGALGLIVILFIGFRWLYPLMRTSHNSDDRHTSSNEHCELSDNTIVSPLYPHNPESRASNRYVPNGSTDKPPSYETLVQLQELPPTYEETATISVSDEENQNQRKEAHLH